MRLEKIDRELDAAVAEKVMGWTHPKDMDCGGEWMNGVVRTGWRADFRHVEGSRPWSPSTDPASDYAVLEFMREHWGDDETRTRWNQFIASLDDLWDDRPGYICPHGAGYRPGDYAKAALMASEASK